MEDAHFPKEPAHTGLTILDRLPKKKKSCMDFRMIQAVIKEGREGVKWELGLALFWTGKMGFTHWDWDLATGNGMNNYEMGMGFLFFSGLCSNILK